jgi:hypothetical protein
MSERWIMVGLHDLVEPDWSVHRQDQSVLIKLGDSLIRHGQLRAPVVRKVGNKWELVSERMVVEAMRQLSWDRAIMVLDLGDVPRAAALRVALSLELQGETDYVRLSGYVAELAAEYADVDEAVAEIARSVPFTPSELKHFVGLLSFDWDQFKEAGDTQATLAWDFEQPEAAILPVMEEPEPEVVVAAPPPPVPKPEPEPEPEPVLAPVFAAFPPPSEPEPPPRGMQLGLF